MKIDEGRSAVMYDGTGQLVTPEGAADAVNPSRTFTFPVRNS
jgi:hypothetical protein